MPDGNDRATRRPWAAKTLARLVEQEPPAHAHLAALSFRSERAVDGMIGVAAENHRDILRGHDSRRKLNRGSKLCVAGDLDFEERQIRPWFILDIQRLHKLKDESD